MNDSLWCPGPCGTWAPYLRSVPVRSAAASEQPESALQKGETSFKSIDSVHLISFSLIKTSLCVTLHRCPTTSTSERRNQSWRGIRRQRAALTTARLWRVVSPDSDTLRTSLDTQGWESETSSRCYHHWAVTRHVCCWHDSTPLLSLGVHLWTLPSLDAGHLSRSPEASPHEHRRPHRVLFPFSQHQLSQRFPLLQQTGTKSSHTAVLKTIAVHHH